MKSSSMLQLRKLFQLYAPNLEFYPRQMKCTVKFSWVTQDHFNRRFNWERERSLLRAGLNTPVVASVSSLQLPGKKNPERFFCAGVPGVKCSGSPLHSDVSQQCTRSLAICQGDSHIHTGSCLMLLTRKTKLLPSFMWFLHPQIIICCVLLTKENSV